MTGFSAHYLPAQEGQPLATVAVIDETANRVVTQRPLPYGEGRTWAVWDNVLTDLGWQRESPWWPNAGGGNQCEVAPL